jgi:hypothetical protein
MRDTPSVSYAPESASVKPRQIYRPEARKGEAQTAYKRQLAYAHLGIDPTDVQCIPFLRTELRRIARLIRGAAGDSPPSSPLDCLQSTDDPEARKVLAAYLSVPASYRKLLPVEAFCCAAGVSPSRILEAITVVAVRQGAASSAIIAAIALPRVVQKTVEMALQDDGTKERMILHRAVGFLPPRG